MIMFGMLILSLLFVIGMVTMMPLYSHAFSLQLPVECEINAECFIQNYVDLDTAEGAWRDANCGHLSYDAHKGTDFRLKNVQQMREGVFVLAVADGKVEATRDEMADVNMNDTVPAQIEGKECGNGMRISHSNGYVSQYCHMKRGSLLVKAGEKVKAGDRLGEIGLSGATEFPHLHLQITDKDGQIIDPFTGPMQNSVCMHGQNLWHKDAQEQMPYTGTRLLQAGFANVAPTVKMVRDNPDAFAQVEAESDVMAFWAEIIGPRKGDVLYLMIFGPDGKHLVQHDTVMEKNRALHFQFIGKKRQEEVWPSGHYQAVVTLKHGVDATAPTAFSHTFDLIIGDPASDSE
ncbi:MAG: M23 family metallopeptidase [Rickettsiales bacterium]|nr:M23 family metallopeptidase [Rickettsiales bacterium]